MKRATANVIGNPTGNLSIASTSDNALAFGVAYEKPEIALRVSALYQKKTYFIVFNSPRSVLHLVQVCSDYSIHSRIPQESIFLSSFNDLFF